MSKTLWDDSHLKQIIKWIGVESIRLIDEGDILQSELLLKSCTNIISYWSLISSMAMTFNRSKEEEFVDEWVWSRFANIDQLINGSQNLIEGESIADSIILLSAFYNGNKEFWRKSTITIAGGNKISFIPKYIDLSIKKN